MAIKKRIQDYLAVKAIECAINKRVGDKLTFDEMKFIEAISASIVSNGVISRKGREIFAIPSFETISFYNAIQARDTIALGGDDFVKVWCGRSFDKVGDYAVATAYIRDQVNIMQRIELSQLSGGGTAGDSSAMGRMVALLNVMEAVAKFANVSLEEAKKMNYLDVVSILIKFDYDRKNSKASRGAN